MSSFFNGNQPSGNPNSTNPLAFPSYTSSQLQRISLDKNNQNLSNLKHRLPLPQESQHHQNHNANQPPHNGRNLNANGLLNPVQSINNMLTGDLNAGSVDSTSNPNANTGSENDTPKRKERKNRPGQKFGAKKKSWVWSWFVQDTSDSNIAACDLCGKVITRLPSDKGSPKKLSEHLKTHKLSTDSINHSRPIPIDGNGVTYCENGDPMSFPGQQQQQPQPQQQASPQHEHQQRHHQQISPETLQGQHSSTPSSVSQRSPQTQQNQSIQPEAPTNEGSLVTVKRESNPIAYSLNNSRRFLSTEFDNAPYSSMKFHRHLLKFLTDNKLSINVLKSHSFQQLIYDLRSDSVVELLELTGLYSSLLEVSRFDNNESMQSIQENNVAQTISRVVEKGNLN